MTMSWCRNNYTAVYCCFPSKEQSNLRLVDCYENKDLIGIVLKALCKQIRFPKATPLSVIISQIITFDIMFILFLLLEITK